MTELPATLSDYMAQTTKTSQTPDKEAHRIIAENDELSFPERFVTRWRKSNVDEIPQGFDFQANFDNVAERMGLKPDEVQDFFDQHCTAWH